MLFPYCSHAKHSNLNSFHAHEHALSCHVMPNSAPRVITSFFNTFSSSTLSIIPALSLWYHTSSFHPFFVSHPTRFPSNLPTNILQRVPSFLGRLVSWASLVSEAPTSLAFAFNDLHAVSSSSNSSFFHSTNVSPMSLLQHDLAHKSYPRQTNVLA